MEPPPCLQPQVATATKHIPHLPCRCSIVPDRTSFVSTRNSYDVMGAIRPYERLPERSDMGPGEFDIGLWLLDTLFCFLVGNWDWDWDWCSWDLRLHLHKAYTKSGGRRWGLWLSESALPKWSFETSWSWRLGGPQWVWGVSRYAFFALCLFVFCDFVFLPFVFYLSLLYYFTKPT
jgi:hypothetical protein